MYLPGDAVHDLFCQFASVTGFHSRIAFTYIGTGADDRPVQDGWTGLMLWILKASGEPWLWSIKPEELGPFLSDTGWTNDPGLAGSTVKRGVEFFGCAVK